MNYSRYTARDFVLDEYFQAWVFEQPASHENFWQNWLEEHPDKKDEVEEARELLLSLSFAQAEVSQEQVSALKARLMHKIVAPKPKANAQPKERIITFAYWQWAASFSILLLTSILLYFTVISTEDTLSYYTGYGEIQELVLPDGSLVTLNANSSLQFDADWHAQSDRKVKLSGEAFFKVVKDSVPTAARARVARKFIVETQEVMIEVLGTQFNVHARHDETEVVLSEGKVQLKAGRQATQQAITMKPGERVVYTQNRLEHQQVEAEKYLSWRKHQLIFDDQPLKTVAQTLEDNYGVQVIFEDEEMQNFTFRGTVPSNNIDVLLEALSGIYHLKISKEGNTLIFHQQK